MINLFQQLSTALTALLLLLGQANGIQTPIPTVDLMLGAISSPIITQTISQTLEGKNAKERAVIKSAKIAKLNPIGVYTNSTYGLTIEIRDIKAIDNEIQLYARAWKDNKPVGFIDGSVEWEHFRFVNPPILVDDPNGNIIREWTDFITKELRQRKLREDPIRALRETLAHTIKVSMKENANVISGKIGNTTLTVYPDAGTGNTTVDGFCANNGQASWATARAGTSGTVFGDTNAEATISQGEKDGNYNLEHFFWTLDTSALTDAAIISAATFSIHSALGGNDTETTNPADLTLVGSTPAANNAIVADDFEQVGTTKYSDTVIDLGTFIGTNQYYDWGFNATGLSNISKTSITRLGERPANDYSDATAPSARSYGQVYAADQAGADNDPKLVVTYTSAVARKIRGIGISR